ncbi:MAG TPA: GWxTD domain-containing protein [Alphaproteobacteria bacterium]|nr:GWxTD domain-containing protein [Alphaproteobacteria bacterium]
MPFYFNLRRFFFVLSVTCIATSVCAVGQKGSSKQDAKAGQSQEQDPLQRPKKSDRPDENKYYKKWLNEDVRWIISEEEERAFKKLTTNTERDEFIEAFWRRRDPTPDTVENEFKDEHYRRIQYANERYSAGTPGWRTDRGRMYIMYGKPDSIETHPMGGPYQRPSEEGGGSTQTYPFEVWRYRYLEGIGQEIEIEFVDDCNCGAYEMTMDRSRKDALLHIPNAGLTTMEELGRSNKADRFRNVEALGEGPFNQNNQTKQFDRIATFAKLNAPPPVKFKDLEEVVNTHIRYNVLPFDVRVDFVRVTSETVLMPIAIQVPLRELTYNTTNGVAQATVNIFGKLTTLSGRTVQTFEDTVHKGVPVELLEKEKQGVALYGKALPMRPGLYRLDIVLKDLNGNKLGTYSRSWTVPDFGEEKLTTSSLILADVVEPVPSVEVGAGNFVIGPTKVIPRVPPSDKQPATFKQQQRPNFWMQVYNLTVDEKTKKPSATVEYLVMNTVSNQSLLDVTESTDQMGNVANQLTLQKGLPRMAPGQYQVTIKVNDLLSKQTVSSTAKFAVE